VAAGGLIRAALPADLPFLREMLFEAAYWRPDAPRPALEQGLARPDLAKLLAGWGRPGDLAVIAESAAGAPTGAAWCRLWTAAEHSYGFLGETVPELGIGVARAWRRRGIGAALLAALLAAARRAGFACMSLSVEPDNPALSLYRRAGFREAGKSGGALTLAVDLARPESASP
jgi:GNAT superfamily N-acetyltransferase